MCDLDQRLPCWLTRRKSLSSDAPFGPERVVGRCWHLNQEASARGSHSAFPYGLYQSRSREIASAHISVAGILLMTLAIMLQELKCKWGKGCEATQRLGVNRKPLLPVKWKDRVRSDSPEEIGALRKVSEEFRPQEKHVCRWGCYPKQRENHSSLSAPLISGPCLLLEDLGASQYRTEKSGD